MSLLNPTILYGLALGLLPVLLHLLMKQKPKKLLFPALRLIEKRQRQSTRRLRLKHIWLLLLRILVISGLVMAIARPSLPAANYALNGLEWSALVVICGLGVGIYQWLARRWRATLPEPVYQWKREQARGWTVGLTVLALLLFVGGPYQHRIAGEIKTPAPTAELNLPVAAVLIFDTSLSMNYLHGGQSRLQVAQDLAADHLETLPSGSRVAVVGTDEIDPVLIFQQTLASAQTRLRSLKTKPVSVPLNDRIRRALLFQEKDRQDVMLEQGSVAEDLRRDRFLRRIYVFTDLSRTAWRLGGSPLLKKELERLESINIFIADVGERAPQNVAIKKIRLSRESVPIGGKLQVSALVEAVGSAAGTYQFELSRSSGGGRAANVDKQTQELQAGSPQWVPFSLQSNLRGPVYHGEVRLLSTDPLEHDNTYPFTVHVSKPPRVLVVAPRQRTAGEWIDALAPLGIKADVVFRPLREWRDISLENFDVVYLINVPGFPDQEWQRLGEFVHDGGGLGIILGSSEVQPRSYERAPARLFLPAVPYAPRIEPNRRMVVDKPEHPTLTMLNEYDGIAIIENDVVFKRFWRLDSPLPAQSVIIAHFNDEDRSPALLERIHGRGRTVMLTSAVDPAQGPNSEWNNWSDRTLFGWPMVAFAESMTQYLSRAGDNVFNIEAGEEIQLDLGESRTERTYLLKRPGFRQTQVIVPPRQSTLLIENTNDIGHYNLVPMESKTPVLGFSAHAPVSESDLNPITKEELDGILGEERYTVARTIDELQAMVHVAELGKEVYPVILALVVILFLGEHLLANWFYSTRDQTQAPEPVAPLSPASTQHGKTTATAG